MVMEITIEGYVQSHWFEALEVHQEENHLTILRGEFADQAALFGVLRRIQDLGIGLISVRPIEKEAQV